MQSIYFKKPSVAAACDFEFTPLRDGRVEITRTGGEANDIQLTQNTMLHALEIAYNIGANGYESYTGEAT